MPTGRTLAGSRVVVTGASAGAGRAIALRFARVGCKVALIARDADRLRDLRREIQSAGAEALDLPCDVADAPAVDAARDRIVEAWSGIDIWVNAAMATVVAPISQMSADEYRRVTAVTYLGTVNGTIAALQPMRSAGTGCIVQAGSALAYRAIPLQSAYCAAKFAVRGYTDALRSELRHEGSRIRVSMVQLPGMNTPQFDWARNKLPRKFRPVGRVYSPEVAADAVLRAVESGAAELWVGTSSIQAIVGQLLAPRWLDRVMARKAWEPQLDDALEPAGRADNLMHAVPGAYGTHGRFGAEEKARALTVDPGRARVALSWGLGAAAVLAIVIARSRKGTAGSGSW
jgi:short-subunit dehydrogenase